MLKTIPVAKARAGMFVHSLGRNWLKHDFVSNSFELNDHSLQKLRSSRIDAIVIDTEKGLDIESEPAPEDTPPVEKPATSKPDSSSGSRPLFPETTAADLKQAKQAYSVATETVRDLMNDVRSGKELKPEQAEKTAEQLIRSIDRNPQTLNAVTRIKTRDEYTFQHSIGVAALLSGFCRGMYSRAEVEEITIGGIIHDIGKIHVPDSILNKPAKLTDEEFVTMKKHVVYSREILEESNNFTRLQSDIALLHHERPDGKGYPLGLNGEELSRIGSIAAIIDVYDALSTRRVYKKAWEPTEALRSMLQWGPEQFNQPLLLQFIKYLGVYPVGTWVELESGRAGFVLYENEDALRPVVQLKVELKSRRLIDQQLDLSNVKNDSIKGPFSPLKFGLDDDLVI